MYFLQAVTTFLLFAATAAQIQFNPTSYFPEVSEEQPVGTEVVRVGAAYVDSFGRIRTNGVFSIPSGGDARFFAIETVSTSSESRGIIRTASVFDRDALNAQTEFVFTATYTTPEGVSSSVQINVFLADINDNAPKFSDSVYTIPLFEGTPSGEAFFTVMATDPDVSLREQVVINIAEDLQDIVERYTITNGRVQYNITSGNGLGHFEINVETGTLSLAQGVVLDIDSLDFYNLTVMATDGGGLSDIATVIINVLDSNDNPPQIFSPLEVNLTIPEDTLPGYVIVDSINATDLDRGLNAEIRFLILSGDVTNSFTIDERTGQIVISSPLDREMGVVIDLTVAARDQGLPQFLQNTIQVIIRLLDVNDYTPQFTQPSFTATVNENSRSQTSVLQIQAVDLDEGPNGTVTYAILEGGDGKFSIDPLTGVIVTNEPLDREENSSYALIVGAFDNPLNDTFQLSSTVTVTITLGDLNDNSPIFLQSSYNTSILDNLKRRTEILQVSATDDDSGSNGQITYVIDIPDPTNPDAIAVNATSGVVYLNRRIRFEDQNLYNFTVQALDGGAFPRTDNTLVTIFVHNVNENPPVFDQSDYNVTIFETTNISVVVINVSAQDLDVGPIGEVRYKIVTEFDGAGSFGVDETSGQIFVNSTLDFDFRDFVFFVVEAYDGGFPQPYTDRANVTVFLIGENDEAPSITFPGGFLPSVPENEGPGIEIVLLSDFTSDPDFGMGGLFSFSLVEIFDQFPNSSFYLNESTGLITSLRTFDREQHPEGIVVAIQTIDFGDPQQSKVTNITVLIGDKNDNPPYFETNATAQVYEFMPPGIEVLANYSALDDDVGINARVEYFIYAGEGSERFTIDPVSGVIFTAEVLNKTVQKYYNLTIIAVDQGLPQMFGFGGVMIEILDANDRTPVFTEPIYNATLSEADPVGTFVAQANATDADVGTNAVLNYYLTPNQTRFTINSSTGEVFTSSQFDRESESVLDVEVLAIDSGLMPLTGSATVRVYLQDINDNQPVFNESVYNSSVVENVMNGTVVTNVLAIDADAEEPNNIITYSLSGNRSESFSIDSVAGEVVVSGEVDWELGGEFTIIVIATDGGIPQLTATTELMIFIEDVNDQAPIFVPMSLNLSIPENTPPGNDIVVGYVQANDLDSRGNNSLITFSIVMDFSNGRFQLDSETGLVTFVRGNLDRERRDLYDLVIRASDHGNPQLHTVDTLYITILDSNEFSPVFDLDLFTGSVPEIARISTSVLTVHATDVDIGSNGELRYSIPVSNIYFLIDEVSGVVFTASEAFDFDESPVERMYEFEVFVTDLGTPVRFNDSALVRVTITDSNDNAPMFIETQYSATIRENLASGTTVLRAIATDADSGTNADIRYTLDGVGSEKFGIDPQTGVLYTNRYINREETPSFDLVITANNSASSFPLHSTVQAFINITDLNDMHPTFDLVTDVYVPEDASVGSVIFTLNPQDGDEGLNGSVVFSLIQGNDEGYFDLDQQSGNVTLLRELDYELRELHIFAVMANDRGMPSLSNSTNVLIHVVDVNDNPPQFFTERLYTTISFAAPIGTTVATLQAYDRDSGSNAQLVFSIMSAHLAGHSDLFEFSSSSDGSLRTVSSLQAFSSTTITLLLSVSNVNSSLSDTVFLNIYVQDGTGGLPRFTDQSYTTTLSESATAGNLVFDFSGQTIDITSFSLWSPPTLMNGTAIFEVDSALGTVRLVSPHALDYETQPFYLLTVLGENSQGDSAYTVLTIMISDENEHPPLFISNSFFIALPETTLTNQPFFTVLATDQDGASPSNVISYSITTSDVFVSSFFGVNQQTGELVLRRGLDFEFGVRSFNLTIAATNDMSAVRFTTETTVMIEVLNGNSFTPVFDQDPYIVVLLENATVGLNIVNVSATDLDTGSQREITYGLHGDHRYLDFRIDTYTGQMFINFELDYERYQFYSLQVVAADGGNPSRSVVASVLVQIQDLNDNSPVWDNPFYIITIPESLPVGSFLIDVLAMDADQVDRDSNGVLYIRNGYVTYNITEGDPIGQFVVDPDTGSVTVASSLNREVVSEYNLTLRATDGGGRFADAYLHITLTDVNDQIPAFTQSPYVVGLPENAPNDTLVVVVKAIDTDLSFNSELLYQFSNSSDKDYLDSSGTFYLNDTTGEIFLTVPIDREEISLYTLVVEAVDMGATPLTGVTEVQIQVVDINEFAPVFTENVFTGEVFENEPRGTSVLQVFSTDMDYGENSTVLYSIIEGNSLGLFTIVADTGIVEVANLIDFEFIQEVDLIVMATDSGPMETRLSNQTNVTVYIMDRNDNHPILEDSYTVAVSEDSNPGDMVLTVFATDVDSGANAELSYTLNSLGDVGVETNFDIDPQTGEIFLTNFTSLDRELTTIYEFIVNVTDQGTPQLHSSAPVSVVITDVNDNTPQFTDGFFQGSLFENLPSSTPVVNITATDADMGTNAEIVFEILGLIREQTDCAVRCGSQAFCDSLSDNQTFGNNTPFSIDQQTGEVFSTLPLDREIASSYIVVIQASDSAVNETQLSNSTCVFVSVLDQNDEVPTFSQNVYQASISEYAQMSEFVLRVVASDQDAMSNAEITFELVSETGSFAINPSTGVIVTLIGSYDRETRDTYNVTVLARDGGNIPLTSTAVVMVTISDENDSPPLFSQSVYSTAVFENLSPAESAFIAVATDSDIGSNANLTYSVEAVIPEAHFEIDSITGVLYTTQRLDREDVESYLVTIVATDGGVPALMGSSLVNVTVLDTNDLSPVFVDLPYSAQIEENSMPSIQLLTSVNAIDGDVGTNAVVVYTLDAVSPASNDFEVNATSGEVHLISVLDAEYSLNYSLVVNASNGDALPGQSTVVVVNVRVIDLNDNAPYFEQSNYILPLLEATPIGDDVIALQAFDEDATNQNSELRYEISGGYNTTLFEINSTSGVVKVARALDRETQPTHVLEITVSDTGFPRLNASTTLTIILQDFNDNDPIFDQSDYTFSISENLPVSSFVGKIQANDLDVQNVTYYLMEAGQFRINLTSGEIFAAAVLDREEQELYTFIAIATDGGLVIERTAEVVVNVTLLDLNDVTPSFQNSTYIVYWHENTTLGSILLTVEAIDEDEGENGALLYSILPGNDSSFFSVNVTSGEIRLESEFDREEQDLFSISVTAHDLGSPSLTGTAIVQIRILDNNDNIPVLNATEYSVSLLEDTSVGSVVLSVGATDRDIGRNANISYYLTDNFAGTFTIDRGSGVIVLAGSLDYEAVQSFSFMVVAQDAGVEPLSSTSDVFIEVIDLNDNPPIFDSNVYTVSIPEDSILGTSVFQIPATDTDSTSNSELRYSITSGNVAAVFSIDESFGLVFISDYLDREIISSYTLGLRVVDSGTPQLTATAVVEVTVLDVNDHPPQFDSKMYSVTIPESLGIGMEFFTVVASDLDSETNANLTYNIIAGNTDGDFLIDSSTGVIQTSKQLDFETVRSYSLTILVSDNGSPLSLSDSSTLRVSLTDINEQPPSFSSLDYFVNVSENAVVGTPVGYLVANDDDSTLQIAYSLLESSLIFAVDRLEGTLYVRAALRVGVYVLTLEASDGDHVTNITTHVTVVPLSLAFTLPLFGQPAFYFEISETANVNSVIGNFDQGVVTSGEINSVFEVGTNGSLILIGQLDHETTPIYIFNVMTTYSNSEPSLYAIVTVRVLDENDNAPVLESSKYNIVISELTQIDTPLLTLRGFDIDSPGVNGEFIITLSTLGNTGGKFEIDPSTGDLVVFDTLDYETQSYYNLTAVVTNHLATPPLSSTAQVVVELIDENDNSPIFSQTIYQVQVSSSTPFGMEILTLEASDFDSGTNSKLVYAITHINIPYSFVINETTGSIATNTTFDLRQDITSTYVISALVSDRGSPQPRSDTTIIFVDVTPENLYPPQFSQPEGYAVEIPETLSLGSSIIEISAIDPDNPTEVIAYSITSGDPSGNFMIDHSNGLIELSMPLEYTEQAQYTLTISAVDSGTPPRMTFVGVNISLIDINDHDPQFVQAAYQVDVFENVTTGSSLVRVTATDPDTINITYQITVNVYDNNVPLFSINGTSGEIFTAASIDREFADVLEILVSAIDSGYPVQRSNSIPVTVVVGDLNDNAPVFNQPNYTIPVVRLLGPEQRVAMITATDADIVGDELTYNVFQDDSNGLFVINSTTGQIVTTLVVPEAMSRVYNLTITASDGKFETAVPVEIQLVDNGEFCNDVGFCTRVREVNCTFDIFPYRECNPFCLGDFGLSPRRRVCISHYCMDSLVPCVAMETCLPSNRACAGVCPEGMSVCPTTDICHVTSLTESCDLSNETCLIGQTLVQRGDNSRYCTLSGNLSIPGLNCTNEGVVFCEALDECHNLTEPFLCQACPGDLQLCTDTGECVTDILQCCGPNGNYCDVLNVCLEVGARCELPNIAPVVDKSLIYIETIESFQPGVSNQGHVVYSLLGNVTGMSGPAVDSQGEEVSVAIVQVSNTQSSGGEWQYAMCVDPPTDLYSTCSNINSSWVTIDVTTLSETNALVLPNTARVRFVRKAIELDGAVWLRVKLWDGNTDGFVSPRKDLVRTHVPSIETTLPYTSNGAYSENATLLVAVIIPLITPPSFSSEASLQLSTITEDVVFANNLGNQVTDIVRSVYVPDFKVLAEDRIEGFEDLVAPSPQYFEQLLPTDVRDLYYSQVERVNPTRKERQLALESGQSPGVAVTLGSNPRGTWQVSLNGDQRLFVNLSSILLNPENILLLNTTARLRFLPMLDLCGYDYILVRPWDGYWNQSADSFLDNGFLVASELEIISTNVSTAVISNYNFNDFERVEIEVTCVPDKPVLLVNQVLLDPIPYRILHRYERVFTVLIERDTVFVRAERERFADFIQITLQEPVVVKRIYPALENRSYISFSIQGNVFSYSEVSSLIEDRQDTLSELGFPVVSLSQDSSYGSGAGCPGDEPQHYHGTHVNTFLSRYTSDGDNNFVGMAVVAMDTATGDLGVWQYHRGNWSRSKNTSHEYDPLNNVWINFPPPSSVTISDTRALLLHGNDRIRFLPYPDIYWGDASNYRTPSIRVKIWDNSEFTSIPGSEFETMNINTNPIEDTVQSLLYPRGLFSDDVLIIEAARLGCDGVVNSGVVHDACCVCGGSGASCEGCDGVMGSNSIHDSCDACGGSLESGTCSGCDFVPFSGTEPGQCLECISVISIPKPNAIQQYTSLNASFTDCNDQCYGTAVLDSCDVCSGGNTAHDPNSDIDCAGVCFGGAIVDSCGDCTGPGTPLSFNQNKDCTGVCHGPFFSDSCGVCQLADEAGNILENRDCDNICFGKATLDGCGFCSGGTTNLTAGFSLDACGVCEGDNTTCVGCDGVIDSGLTTDSCGECGGKDCGCFQLNSITPNRGPRTGGTEIVLQGAGFFLNDSARLEFQFDRTSPNCGAPYIFPNTSASVRITCLFITADQQLQAFAIPVDQSTIRCITQSTSNFNIYIREFLVQVRIDDGPFSNPIPYFYDDYSNIVVNTIVPLDREVNLLGQVSFQGENFLNTFSITCLVYNFARCVKASSQFEIQSPLSFPAAFVSSSEISCQLPAADVPCQVSVRLTLDGQESGIINSNVTSFTYQYGAPRVESIYFSSDLSNLIVQFDRQVDLDLPNSVNPNCIEIFRADTYNLIGGEDAKCFWADNSQQQLVISLPRTATVKVTSPITFIDGVIITRYELYSFGISNMTFAISAEQNTIRPVAVLNGPRSIPFCGQFSYSGINSQYPGYGSFEYYWTILVHDSSIGNYSQILNQLDSFDLIAPVITLTSDLFQPGIEYYLQLYIVNSIGLESETESISLLKETEPRPSVVILGTQTRQLEPGEDLIIQSVVVPSQCDNVPQAEYNYIWTLTKVVDQRRNLFSDVDLSNVQTQSPEIVIPSSYLEQNSSYGVSLQVTATTQPSPTQALLSVSVQPLLLQARVNGGNRTVSQGREIVLDGRSSSQNPSLPTATFIWSCKVQGSLEACHNTTLTGLIPVPISLPGSDYISFPASDLEADRTYMFTVRLQQEATLSEASVSIEIVLSRPPIVEINNPQAVVLSTESVYLDGLVYSSVPVETVYWESLPLLGQGTVDLSDSNIVQSQTTYLPSSDITLATSLTDYLSLPLEASIATNSTSRASLVVSANTLTSGLRYTFRLIAASREGTSYSQVTIVPSSPPISTRLVSTPSSGFALETEFVFDTLDAIDDMNDSPFLYAFGIVEDTRIVLTSTALPDHMITWISGVQTSNTLSAVLPSGEDNMNSTLVVMVRVFNRNGESSDALTEVIVLPNIALTDEASYTTIVDGIRNDFTSTKNWNSALSKIIAVLLEMNKVDNVAFVNIKQQILDLFVDIFENYLPPSLTHYQLATSVLTQLSVSGIVDTGEHAKIAAVLNTILQWYDSETAIEQVSVLIPSQSGDEPLFLQSTYIQTTNSLLSSALALELLTPLNNLLSVSPNPGELSRSYVDSVDLLSRIVCKESRLGEEATEIDAGLSKIYTTIARPEGAFNVSGVFVNFKESVMDVFQTQACIGANVPCMETCLSGVLYTYDLLGNSIVESTGSQLLELKSETHDTLLSEIEGSDPQNVKLFSDVLSVSVPVPSQNTFLQISNLDSPIQVLFPKNKAIPVDSQPLCLYREVGGGRGSLDSEWLLDSVSPPQTTPISGSEYFVCEYNHLTEFAVGILPPPVITTQPPPPTTTPTVTMETTTEPTTMTTRATTEPTTIPPEPQSPVAAIAIVIVLILIVVIVIVVVVVVLVLWRKKRSKKLRIEPAEDETDGQDEDARLTKAGPLTPEESKVPMQVILCPENGERQLIGKLNVLPSIRLRELRYQLADNFAIFKNKPFYFMTRQLCDIEPAAEQQQFVSLVFGDKPIFVREVTAENELTKKHFCVCGNAAQFECSNCSSQGYCSPECQHKHWNEQHQKQCSKLSERRRRSNILVGRPSTLGNLSSEARTPLGFTGSPRRVTLATAPSGDNKATSPTSPGDWKSFMTANKAFQQSPQRSTSMVLPASQRMSLGVLASEQPSFSQQEDGPRSPASLGPLQNVPAGYSLSRKRTLPPLSRSSSLQHPAGPPQPFPRTSFQAQISNTPGGTTFPNFYGSSSQGLPTPLQTPLRAQPDLFTRPDRQQIALRPPAPSRHISVQSVGSDDLGFSMNVSRDVRNEPLLESDEEDYETSSTNGSDSQSPTPTPRPSKPVTPAKETGFTGLNSVTPTRDLQQTDSRPVTPDESGRQSSTSRPTSSKRVKSSTSEPEDELTLKGQNVKDAQEVSVSDKLAENVVSDSTSEH